MKKCCKRGLASLVAAIFLAVTVSAAPARNLSVSEQAANIVWTPLELVMAGRSFRCNATLGARFHYRTMVKSDNALIGYINSATMNTCTGGSATILAATLPWHITYRGFSGTLPNITNIRMNVIGFSFNWRPEGSIACLARSTAENPLQVITNIAAGGIVTGMRADETATIPIESFFCAFGGEGTFRGTGTVRTPGGSNVAVRLI